MTLEELGVSGAREANDRVLKKLKGESLPLQVQLRKLQRAQAEKRQQRKTDLLATKN